MATNTTQKTVRVGVFDTVAEADRAINELLESGFTRDEVGVLCTEECRTRFFPDVPRPGPAGNPAPTAMAAGGALGATVGGLALAASALATGGATLVAGGVLVAGGAIAGTFAGLMSTFGFENEKADYYAQALQEGKILVTAEVKGEDNAAKLAHAARILHDAGAARVGKVSG